VAFLLLSALLVSCAGGPKAKGQPEASFSLQVEPTEAQFPSWPKAVLRVRFKNHTSAGISLPLGASGGPNLDNFYYLRFRARRDGDVYQAAFRMHSLRFSRHLAVRVPANGTSTKLEIPLSLLVWRHDPKLKYETPEGTPYPTGKQWFDHAVAQRIVPPPGVYSCRLGYVSDRFPSSGKKSFVWSNVTEIRIQRRGGGLGRPVPVSWEFGDMTRIGGDANPGSCPRSFVP
jgi:hypothetical protein